MKKVIVSYGDKIIIADSIENALEQIFNYTDGKVETPTVPSDNIPKADGTTKEKIKSAKELFDKAIEAQKTGDWAKYGEYIKKLEDTLSELNK